jgi:GT2 family glycosyltransferase
MTKARLTYINILNWNGYADTIACVESCNALQYTNFRVLIIDNGSTDGSERILRERFPDLEFIQTGTNLGFAGGNNIGIKYALNKGADFIWLLNNDTIVDPKALSELVNFAQHRDDIGIVGSKIYYYDHPDIIWFAGGRLQRCTGTSAHIGHLDKDEGRFSEIVEVAYITGCSLLIKREVIDNVGLMDERFFLYFEEIDWNQRVKERGYSILYVPTSIIWHKVSVSTGVDSPSSHYYFSRNSLLFTLKHNPFFLPTVTMKRLADIIYLLFHKKFAGASAAVRGLLDFFFFRFGRMCDRQQ